MLHHVAAHVVADRVGVPHRPAKQVLQPIRGGVPDMLGDRPAVRPRQLGQQPGHELPHPPPRLHPSEPTGNSTHQLLEHHLPPGRVYPLARGHRRTVQSPHNP